MLQVGAHDGMGPQNEGSSTVLDRTTKRHRLLGSAAMLLAAMSVSACGDSTTPEAAKPATAAPPPTSKAVPTQTAAQPSTPFNNGSQQGSGRRGGF